MRKDLSAQDSLPSAIHIVAGPTAGGKSAFALDLARRHNGIVINCDSMQIYDGLPILTAQPAPEEQEEIPHTLYGALHPNDPCSAGRWREMAAALIEKSFAENRTPIIAGGTGLYIKALMEGLSPIPTIPPEIREAAIALQKKLGNPGFHEALQKRDPVMAACFHPAHTARLLRAWEVLEATGRSLAEWQAQDRDGPPEHWHFEIHKIMPEREDLHRRIDARFMQMMDNGAPEETAAFAARIENGEIDEDAPLNRALGFRPLRDYLRGILTKEEAVARAQAETRQYAKRQVTWFKNQL